ncbi:hypothetical protein [Fundidesulfovibrio soli]|uniref:hypothetical protein n=1 Tax=Fundidesulfovibrio soli TaxID=2922716 RepID=UPI001FAEAC30|nr:hypothetical protein [Fundidesulfovibrio soli]
MGLDAGPDAGLDAGLDPGVRVACIGNMNNNYFCLVRYLRDMGIQADLLRLNCEQEHFHPSFDSYCEGYKAYTVDLPWGDPASFAALSPEAIARDLAPYTHIVACNYAPAFVHKAGRRLDAFCPHGSDYTEVPYYKDESGHGWHPLSLAQRAAIQGAAHVFAPAHNPERERYWAELAPRGIRHQHSVPILYMPEYAPEALAARVGLAPSYGRVLTLRQSCDLLVYHHSRHVWASAQYPDDLKGNDVLFKGLALFAKARPGVRVGLVCHEYGVDVEASKRLIAELGIADLAHWMPLAGRKQVMPCAALADVVASGFAYSWKGGGVVSEALCLGKPLLGRRDDHLDPEGAAALYPMLTAATPEEVAARLAQAADDPAGVADIGRRGRQWMSDSLIAPALERFRAIFTGASECTASR